MNKIISLIKIIFYVVILGVLTYFAIYNMAFTKLYWAANQYYEMPLILIIFIFTVLGIILGLFTGFIRILSLKNEIYKLKKINNKISKNNIANNQIENNVDIIK